MLPISRCSRFNTAALLYRPAGLQGCPPFSQPLAATASICCTRPKRQRAVLQSNVLHEGSSVTALHRASSFADSRPEQAVYRPRRRRMSRLSRDWYMWPDFTALQALDRFARLSVPGSGAAYSFSPPTRRDAVSAGVPGSSDCIRPSGAVRIVR